MDKTESISEHAVRQAEMCLLKISEIAEVIHGLASEIINDGDNHDPNKGVAARELSSQIGWLVDVAAESLGLDRTHKTAEQWMLPPAYHATNNNEGLSHG